MKVELTDAQWARIARLIPKPTAKPKGGRPRADDRAVMEGILWVLRSGARWRDMPDRYPGMRRAGGDSGNGSAPSSGFRSGVRF